MSTFFGLPEPREGAPADAASTSRTPSPGSPPASPMRSAAPDARAAQPPPLSTTSGSLPASSAPLMAPECLPAGCGDPVDTAGDPLASPGASPTRMPSPVHVALSPDLVQRLPAPEGLATLTNGDVYAAYLWLRGRAALAQGLDAYAHACLSALRELESRSQVRGHCAAGISWASCPKVRSSC
jgi:hypothetical protein